ncbi:MAG: ion channel [Candidatus Peregrinibacteria bacterium]
MRPYKGTNGRFSLHTRMMEKVTSLPYATLFLVWFTLAGLFGMAYAILATYLPAHAPQQLLGLPTFTRIGDSLYYSIITATSTGYGDIVPMGFSKVLASTQAMSSLFIFAVLVTKLMSKQQELAVRQMHRLTYEDVFHNTREGLFIIRKDFDRLITKVEQRDMPTSEDWEDMATAFKQGQSLLLEIPDFYDTENQLYMIDERREQLLQEAVHRTLHRVNQLIDECALAGLDWMAQRDVAQELTELLHVVEKVTALWRERSPYAKHESFETILRLKERAGNRMKGTIGK